MKTIDMVHTAVANTFRNRVRTLLTSLAIIIGALSLSVTLAVNHGLNSYIDETVSAVGSTDTLSVYKPAGEVGRDGIARYSPDTVAPGPGRGGVNPTGQTITFLDQEDLDRLAVIPGVSDVRTVRTVAADFIQLDGASQDDRWELVITPGMPGVTMPLAAGEQVDLDASALEIVLPRDYVDVLEVGSAGELVGQTVKLGVRDPMGEQEVIAANVVGVSDPVLTFATPTAMINPALTEEIYSIQARGLPDDQKDRWGIASVSVADEAGVPLEESVAQVKADLAAEGYEGQTLDDLLGQFRAFFDAILLMLVGFAVITLVAGSLGIINTLLMSVQERTKEIGLLKAVGLTSGRVFALFSLEAVTIGVLSAAVGIGVPLAASGPVNRVLAEGPLSGVPGLNLLSFTPTIVVAVAAVIIGVAFLAGTLPAARAAAKDPITALRYE